MKSSFILLVTSYLLFCPYQSESARQIPKSRERQGKFFSLFSIVSFKNFGCQSSSEFDRGQSLYRNGSCYTNTECEDKGGSAEGNCAAGFGVCCVFIVKNDDANVSENCSYIQNPSFPDTDNEGTYTYTLEKCSNDVCSIRLDFEVFSLDNSQLDETATPIVTCADIFLVTTSTNQDIPEICGENSGHHMYVDVGPDSGSSADIVITLSGTVIEGRQWDIKVTQLECSNPNRPTDPCLQYLTGYTGRIETFNYQGNGRHLPNQNYAVCIKPQPGMCCIQYTVCADPPGEGFTLDTSGAVDAMTDDMCNGLDYVTIAMSADTCQSGTSTLTSALSSRYCGSHFNFNMGLATPINGNICDCTPFFSVDIFSDGQMDTNNGRGICLEYKQIPCA